MVGVCIVGLMSWVVAVTVANVIATIAIKANSTAEFDVAVVTV